MADFLAKPEVSKADIIAVQEPWENPYNDTTYHPLKQTHELLFPSSAETGGRARVCIYISKRVGTNWTHYAHSEFCQEVRLQAGLGEICLFNTYNECGTTGTVELLGVLLEGRRHVILAGDFNLHHPAWGGIQATQDLGSDRLIELCDEVDLDLWLEPGTITRGQNGERTTIDLLFGTPDLTERLVVCELALDCHADSDHLPIRALLDIDTVPIVETKRRLWKAMDTEKFDIFVADNLPMPPPLTTPRQIDDAVDHLIDIVRRGVHESTPWARSSPHANPSWTKECGEAVKHSRRMFRQYLATHSEEDWETYRLARNQKGKVIKAALRRGFRSFIEEAVDQGPQGLWRVAKWARNRGQQQGSTMPVLKTAEGGVAETDEDKVNLLRKVFFPQPPEADLSDIRHSHASYREQYQLPPVSDTEVRAAIKKAPPDKAPGYDTLPNKLWRILAGTSSESKSEARFIPFLTAIFNACVRIGHNPQHFQTSVTVTLRKAGPRDYRIPKSYRPVALLNTLGKVLEAIIATRVAWLVEEHKLLPDTHLGGRKGVSVDHAIQLILGRVYQAWGEGKIASMLLLDVAGAYDMVSHERLLFNMQQMGLGVLTPWVQSFLTGRSTRIKLPNGHLSEEFPTPTGIPQGSPISPILFPLFNAPLVRACTLRGLHYGESEAYGWVDDVCILAVSNSYEENIKLLEKALQRASTWAKKHAAKFAPDKFELIHFNNPKSTTNTTTTDTTTDTTRETPPRNANIWEVPDDPSGHDGMPVIIPGDPIPTILKPTDTAKYLGVWLDKHLNFTIHRKKMLAKGASSLEALRGISGSTWGSSLIAMRKVYQAVIIPQMLWGLSAWYCPAARATPGLDKLTNELTKIQKRAAILISGAFRGTAGAALDTELFITPIKLRLQQIVEETTIRILTGPQWACPQTAKATRTRKPAQRRLGGWAPIEAIALKKPLRLQLGEKWEEKQAFVLAPWEARISCVIENQEAALETHNSIYEDVACDDHCRTSMIFTDGSGFAGHIGASTASHYPEITSQRRYLGTDSQSTVYAAELSGIEIALAKINKESTEIDLNNRQPTAREVIVFSDSQAAIQAVQNPQRPSGQYVLSGIYNHVRAIRSRDQGDTSKAPTNITIRWIPAHVGVDGNEFADGEAKSAALLGAGIGVATGSGTGEPIIRLAAAAKRAVRQRIRERWEKQWERERTSAPTKRLVQAPNKKTLRLYEGLSKPQCAILIQMRTMRIGLRHFLFKIKAAETDRCNCDEGSQTPKHILMQCPRYVVPRTKLWEQLWGIGINEMDYDKIVSNPQATRYVVNFMHRTGLLQQFQHVGIEEENDDDEPRGLAAMDLGVEDDGY
ncbi:Endonuclease/exonuclease/phosphatase [Penicillium camemberti]|uniref:Endonuclease/exonuclease/phosphatase n=1 Tax=Penicillium camemberti (strain FM 013) TaxID=1429867 RepID=A0A0G4PV74_PENC3|nr:Endonuclease/exonuclease/phosphatase [Penicillium camemberti]